jgi:hypothetical protein
VRPEGLTEMIGDILIICTGGAAVAAATPLPTINITVSLGTNVTSRLLGNGGAANASEALLIIDEAGGVISAGGGLTPLVAGFGPDAPQKLCTTPSVGAGTGGCVEYANMIGGYPVMVGTPGRTAPGANVFQGLVSGNQVTFNGIPILAPVVAGSARTFRITNIRANVSALGAGAVETTQFLASLSISGGSLPVSNPVLIAGWIQPSLRTSVRTADNTLNLGRAGAAASQCNGLNAPAAIALLRFSENWGTAFKTRVGPSGNWFGHPGYTGQSGFPIQNVPGNISNSESNFVFPAASGNGYTAGLADFGTRLKAVFHNIPPGMRVFVSTTNVPDAFAPTMAAPAATSTSLYAALVQDESSIDGNGSVPALASTTSVNNGSTQLAELPVANGSATAIWEVINTNPSMLKNFDFGVWVQYVTPPLGTATVNLSFAPTVGASGTTASSSLPMPRFADVSTAMNLVHIGPAAAVNQEPIPSIQAPGLRLPKRSASSFRTPTGRRL